MCDRPTYLDGRVHQAVEQQELEEAPRGQNLALAVGPAQEGEVAQKVADLRGQVQHQTASGGTLLLFFFLFFVVVFFFLLLLLLRWLLLLWVLWWPL